jgi:hypothetical protein
VEGKVSEVKISEPLGSMKIKRTKRTVEERQERLRERCAALAEVIRAIQPFYYAPNTTENQRRLLETMIGAAIWYFPSSNDLWTGQISVEAMKALLSGSTVCHDHDIPRKVAARELLGLRDTNLSAATVLELYRTKFGRFNKVTPKENRRLMKYQKAAKFVSSAECYRNAGIQLVQRHELEASLRQPKTSEKDQQKNVE